MDTKILNENDFKFKKNFGQNFIFDKNLLNAIVGDAKISKNDEVLEIGPGAGTLSSIIASNCKKLVCYEIDKKLEPLLSESLKPFTNAKVIFEDALKADIIDIENNFDGRYKLVANLPYYITTPLIFKFIEQAKCLESITIMVQKEVADRIVAKPGSSEYGTLSAILDFYGNASIARKVSRKMFIPSPNVDSALVHIELIKNKYDADENNFKKVVRCAFGMRRKTLINNLSTNLGLGKEKINSCLEKMNLNPLIRGEALSTNEFVILAKLLFD